MIQEGENGVTYKNKILKYVKRTLAPKRKCGLCTSIDNSPGRTNRNLGICIQMEIVLHVVIAACKICLLVVSKQSKN